MHIQKRYILILFLVCQTLLSCIDESADNIAKLPERTILFYMAADNELSKESQDMVDSLIVAWNIDGRNNLVIYQDRGKGYNPRLLQILKGDDGKGTMKVIEEYEDENSASSIVFTRVLNRTIQLFPGSDYGLIVFSETTGRLSSGTYIEPYTIMTDGTNTFELGSFADCIPDGMLNFIVFSSDLMSSAEIAYELKDKTGYIVASSAEMPSPKFTPLCRKILHRLYAEKPQLTEMAKDYYEYNDSLPYGSHSATISVIRPSYLSPLSRLIIQAEKRVDHWEYINRNKIQYFDIRSDCHFYYDLGGYIDEIGTDTLSSQLDSILEKAVIYKAATKGFEMGSSYGFEINQHSGLTIYVPVPAYKYLNERRKTLKIFQNIYYM